MGPESDMAQFRAREIVSRGVVGAKKWEREKPRWHWKKDTKG